MVSDGPVDATHVAVLEILLVHVEDGGETLRGVAALGHFEIAAQGVAEIRVGAAFDDELGAFGRILAAQVGHALFGHDDLDGVLAVVGMAERAGRSC